MDTKVWYIHGANASAVSFNHLKMCLPNHQFADKTYNCFEPLEETITKFGKDLEEESQICIISHSMGGLIGVALSQSFPSKISQLVTISCPFAGSETACHLRLLFPFNTFLKNICTSNSTLHKICGTGAAVPTLNIVSTAGDNLLETDKNDGVVTIRSQKALQKTKQVEIHANHFEILMHQKTMQAVQEFLWIEKSK